ncbi:hypothetical protein [Streptomyces sp. 4F14]|uniref:hypothetical protein n=1 Tax=Streptomyces sp. 4F14 TaxID=3394380 RepID=UPI003A852846
MTDATSVPVTAVLLHALAVLEIPGFLDIDEDFVAAHPPHIPQDKALDSEHIVLTADGYQGSVADYTGGVSAWAYGASDGGDFDTIERVYQAPPGLNLMAHAAACAKAVAEWFASRQETTDASGGASGADGTDDVRTSTTEVC